jgi:uncharacterized delta-60 repeat protein
MNRPKSPLPRPLRFEHLEARRLLAVGDLDPTFGVDGKVLTTVAVAESSFDEVRDLARQSDGKLVEVGLTRNGHGNVVAISRFQDNGLLDPTFDGDGKLTTTIGASDDFANAVAIQPDGKIVVVATSRQLRGFYNYAVLRYNVDGALDSTFGNGGVVLTEVGDYHSEPKDVAIQSDGKIVVVGYSSTLSNSLDFGIVRYNVNGSLDSTFDGDGMAIVTISAKSDVPDSVVIQTDGKIVAAGYSGGAGDAYNLAVVRLGSNGLLDSSFDGDGIRTLPFTIDPASPSFGYLHRIQLALQTDGKLVAAGLRETDSTHSDFGIVRYNTNGSLDVGFGSGGQVTTPAGMMLNLDVGGLAIQADGKILIAGPSGPDSWHSSLTVLRYLPGGTLDGTFGIGGAAINDLSPFSFDQVYGMVLLPEGSIAIAYQAYNEPGFDNFALVRMTSIGGIDETFGIAGIATLNIADQYANVTGDDMVIARDEKILVAGTRSSYRSGTAIAITRYNTNGSLDVNFDDDGQLVIEPTAWYLPLIEGALLSQPDGKAIVVGSIGNMSNDYDIYLQRLLPDGKPDTSFGSAGISIASAGAFQERVNCAVLQPDGKILVGTYQFVNGKISVVLGRFLPNGAVDVTFGTGGFVPLVVGTGSFFVYSLAVQPDGKIIAVGESQSSATGDRVSTTLVRLDSKGMLDPSFDGDGIVTTDFVTGFSYAFDIAVLPDGKLLVGGRFHDGVNDNFAAARYLANGTLDAGFGVGGKVITDIGSPEDAGYSLILLEGGKFIIGGKSYNGNGHDFALAWYNSDGTLDTNVQGTGLLTIRFDRFDNVAQSIALLKSGDFIISGTVNTDTETDIGLAKLEGNGTVYVPWHSGDHPLDATRDPDHKITPRDALVVINELNDYGSHPVPAPQSKTPVKFSLDTNGDNAVSPIDALQIINYLNAPPPPDDGSEGEGDPTGEVASANTSEFIAPANVDLLFSMEADLPARKGARGSRWG